MPREGNATVADPDGEVGHGRYGMVRAAILAEPETAGLDGVVGTLQRLCRSLTASLSVSGAAVMLMSPDGSEGVAAATDDRCRGLEELQFTTGEGPCHDAYAARRPVLTPDLRSPAADRWPGYTSAALESGVQAVFAFPLHVGGAGFGVLDVFSEQAGSLTRDQVATALTFAQVAVEVLQDGQLTTADGRLEPGLAAALDYRAEIHQAQGMVMVALGVPISEALTRMRAHAFSHSLPLIDLARGIINGQDISTEELT